MQPVDPSQLLRVLESPMGAAMLPQLAQQNGLAMDQGRASLADTIARTGIAQDGNRRSNEMHPLEMDSTRAATAGRQLTNQGAEFDLGVKRELGQEHFVAQEKQKLSSAQIAEADKVAKNLASAAGMLQDPPGAAPLAPGMRRDRATQVLTKMGLQHMLPSLLSGSEDEIGSRIRWAAEESAKMSRQFLQEDRKQDGATSREILRGEYGLDRERLKGEMKLKAVEAAARLKAKGGKDPKNFKTFEEAATYYSVLAFRLPEGEDREDAKAAASYFAQQVDQKPATSGATQTTLDTSGKTPRLVPTPKNLPPPALPATNRPVAAPQAPVQSMAPTPANAAKLPQNQPAPQGVMSAEDYLKKFTK